MAHSPIQQIESIEVGRDWWGPDGFFDSIRQMLCFWTDCSCWPKCFPPNWFYDSLADHFQKSNHRAGYPAMMRYFGWDWADSWLDCCCCIGCCGSKRGCCQTFYGLMLIGIPILFIAFLAFIVFTALDILMGFLQVFWGILSGLVTFVIPIVPITKETVSGLPPTLVSVFHITHGLMRICVPLHWITACFYPDIMVSYLEQTGKTVLVDRDWAGYKRLGHFVNIFSMRGFLLDKNDLSFYLLRIPVVNMFAGVIHFGIGCIGMIFGLIMSAFIETMSISWIEWAGLHLMKGCLGMSLIGVYVYDSCLATTHLARINNRFINIIKQQLQLQPNQDPTEEQLADFYTSYGYFFRTWNDYLNFVRAAGKQLNPYSMEWLFVENGQMNLMDYMACIPIAGFIPFAFRFIPCLILWWTHGFWHSACRQRLNRPSYFRTYAWMTCTGFFAGTVFFTWVNIVFYYNRKSYVKTEERIQRVVIGVPAPSDYGTSQSMAQPPQSQDPPTYSQAQTGGQVW
jgi:hypothetical protein